MSFHPGRGCNRQMVEGSQSREQREERREKERRTENWERHYRVSAQPGMRNTFSERLWVSRAVLQKCPYPAPVWTPHFVSTFNYTSPVTRHHTSWLLSPQPLSFDFIPTLSC
ncbi:hypothetical protein D4764_15G0012590 [Takifugu flavidus]|uniref:Uncharacterized protein n=1 Tax=Takifugu flavidus TaxID=433684 RepID=A0A5C6P2X4_9TELE|nr:hypothetical protein D4764_15G0012590 [Takifugu flavidus]